MAKFRTKYETVGRKVGIYGTAESVTDKSLTQDAEIYSCLEKYGMQAMINKSKAKEELYLDNTNRNMSMADALRVKEEINEYFKNLPAKARKVFGDNVEQFYFKWKNNELDDMIETGVISAERAKLIMEGRNETRLEINNQGLYSNNSSAGENDNGNIQDNKGILQQSE